MENYPPQMHSEPPLADRKVAPLKGKRIDTSRLSELIEAYPLLFWGGIWVSVLLVGAIAISGLVSPGLSGRRTSSAAFGSNPGAENVQTASHQSRLPFWVFGAIAVSCTAAGSFLVTKRLSHTDRPRKLVKPGRRLVKKSVKQAKKPAPRPARSQAARAPRKLKPFLDTEFAQASTQQPYPQPYAPPPAATEFKLPPTLRKSHATQKQEPVPKSVTVLPPEQNHPLDWAEPSIADAMDIRKRHTLSSWM